MPRNNAGRWKGWRVNEQGRSIKSNAERDGKHLQDSEPVQVSRMPESEMAWYSFPAKKAGTCAGCNIKLEVGMTIVWNRGLDKAYCPPCATTREIVPRKPGPKKRRRAR